MHNRKKVFNKLFKAIPALYFFFMYSCSAPATEYEIEMYKKEIATVNRRWELAVSAFQSTGADQENKPAESAAYRLYKQNTIDLFVLP
ncbi:MAG TPA: hypothetical protein DC049_02140, partial [Spirochaetia bacterium]|nr:hypothetical protein [Spirochaetia bacterium]